jgi:hypothetical protein
MMGAVIEDVDSDDDGDSISSPYGSNRDIEW